MEDLALYLDEIVEPTVKDFEEHPTSRRLAFLTCVAVFHGIDYLAHPRRPQNLKQEFRKESSDFALVDDVAHAFKHVRAGNPAEPRLVATDVIARPPANWDTAAWDLSRWDDPIGGVTLGGNRNVDLFDVVTRAVAFLRSKTNGVQT
jgi:hypothetical protein